MTDFDTTNLASGYFTASVTIGATASRMGDLVAAAASANSGMTSRILQMTILATDSAGASRGAILFGGSATQDGYLAAGAERTFPIRAGGFYVKRAGGVDVTAIVDVYTRIVS